MRAGAVVVSAVAFGWVVVQAQGGCGTEPAPPAPEAAPAQRVDPKAAAEPAPTPPSPEPPSAVAGSETPPVKPAESAGAEKPAVYFSASKSGDFAFDEADSAGAGVGTLDPPKPVPSGKGNNAGTKPKPKPKAFFPASKSGRVREPMRQAPNAPATK